MRELICIVCPKGCHLKIDEEKDWSVTGNQCPRGAEYGKMELTHPTRVVTSTVRCIGGAHSRCPVKTDRAVPKEQIGAVMEALNQVTLTAPVRSGQVIVADICGTQADLIATRDIESNLQK